MIHLNSVFLKANPILRLYFAMSQIHKSMKTNSLEVKDTKKILHSKYQGLKSNKQYPKQLLPIQTFRHSTSPSSKLIEQLRAQPGDSLEQFKKSPSQVKPSNWFCGSTYSFESRSTVSYIKLLQEVLIFNWNRSQTLKCSIDVFCLWGWYLPTKLLQILIEPSSKISLLVNC